MEAPETVTDAVRWLAANGYDGDFTFRDGALRCHACGRPHGPERLVVRHTFRFEGMTDPADEAIVLGVECPDCGARGTVVSAYGPDAEPQLLALLDRLAD